MDATKIFCVLCAFLLIICISLSIASVVVLEQFSTENQKWQSLATALLDNQYTIASDLSDKEKNPPLESAEETIDADVLYNRLCVREINGKIGVYSEDGYLIRTVNVATKTLPTREQEALKRGIYVNSWKELLSLIQDYE